MVIVSSPHNYLGTIVLSDIDDNKMIFPSVVHTSNEYEPALFFVVVISLLVYNFTNTFFPTKNCRTLACLL